VSGFISLLPSALERDFRVYSQADIASLPSQATVQSPPERAVWIYDKTQSACVEQLVRLLARLDLHGRGVGEHGGNRIYRIPKLPP